MTIISKSFLSKATHIGLFVALFCLLFTCIERNLAFAQPPQSSNLQDANYFDQTFRPTILDSGGLSVNLKGIIVQPDGKILVSGVFSSVNGANYQGIVRLKPNGSIDETFNPVTFGPTGIGIETMVLQSDGRILIGGLFGTINGVSRTSVARLNSDGSLDPSFGVVFPDGFQGQIVYSILPLDNGQILIGGQVSFIWMENGLNVYRRSIVRLNSNGTHDRSFGINNTGFSDTLGAVRAIVLNNNKIIIGGEFTRLNGDNTKLRLGSLNLDGTLDSSFNAPANSIVWSMAKQEDGRIVVGGSFSTISGVNRRGVARIVNGSLDTSFNPGLGATIGGLRSVITQPNGKVIIGGNFTSFDGANYTGIARLNTDGSPDISFKPVLMREGGGVFVTALGLQPDGKVLIGGSFFSVNGLPQASIARFYNKSSFDFDGDGKADQTVFRSSNTIWYLLNSQSGFTAAQFGISTDKITPADFDGDGRTDISVFRNGIWYWLNSSNGSFNSFQFGVAGDVPIPADFTGDGRAELAVYRSGIWYIWNLANNQFNAVQFGIASDKVVPADFDGDGATDIAVYRDGVWYWLRSSDNGFRAVQFGIASDKPTVGDYDGDGKADQAVYRSGIWYVLGSTQGFYGIQFGIATDIPVAADYDGDGKTDIAVYRTGNGTWYWLRSSDNGFRAVQFGIAEDKPIPAAFVPQ